MKNKILKCKESVKKLITGKHQGVDGIVVTVGLCIIALLLCVIFKDAMTDFINTLVGGLTSKAEGILGL